jgi:hypothetical protein
VIQDSRLKTQDSRPTAGAEAEEALVIVAKYPEVGSVKTRLAQHIGQELASQLYLGFIRDLEAKFSQGRRLLFWAYTPAGSNFPGLVNSGSQCFPQEGEYLGARLHNIFRRLFRQGYQRVAIMSSDSPQMLREWIDEAFARLLEIDVVLAPADDGGYNLVGLRADHDLFTGITMSTPRVLADTIERARMLNLSVHLLPASFDVDAIEDLEKLRRFLTQSDEPLIHTREVLGRLKEK